jgi:hypothetical protein
MHGVQPDVYKLSGAQEREEEMYRVARNTRNGVIVGMYSICSMCILCLSINTTPTGLFGVQQAMASRTRLIARPHI